MLQKADDQNTVGRERDPAQEQGRRFGQPAGDRDRRALDLFGVPARKKEQHRPGDADGTGRVVAVDQKHVVQLLAAQDGHTDAEQESPDAPQINGDDDDGYGDQGSDNACLQERARLA